MTSRLVSETMTSRLVSETMTSRLVSETMMSRLVSETMTSWLVSETMTSRPISETKVIIQTKLLLTCDTFLKLPLPLFIVISHLSAFNDGVNSKVYDIVEGHFFVAVEDLNRPRDGSSVDDASGEDDVGGCNG